MAWPIGMPSFSIPIYTLELSVPMQQCYHILVLHKHKWYYKLSLCFNWAPRHEGVLFDLGTRWRCVVSFTPRPLYSQGTAPGTHWIGGWVSPRAGLDAVVKEKFPVLAEIRTSDHPTRSPALYHWNNPAQSLLQSSDLWGIRRRERNILSSEANSHSASQEIPHLLWYPNVRYRVHKSLPLIPILSQMHSVHTLPPCFPKIHFNIILPSTPKASVTLGYGEIVSGALSNAGQIPKVTFNGEHQST
jgi:hypothetical protein